MHRNIARRPSAIVACSIAILCCSVVARAQAVDTASIRARTRPSMAMAVQPDGKILVGGGFTGPRRRDRHDGAQPHRAAQRRRHGRPHLQSGHERPVHAVAVQPDGKILIGGNFTSVGGGTGLTTARKPHRAVQRRRHGRHQLQSGREPRTSTPWPCSRTARSWSAATSRHWAAATGARAMHRPAQRRRFARQLQSGREQAPSGAPIVYTMALQPDGKIVVGGYFNGLGGGTGTTPRNYIGRINADGTVDAASIPAPVPSAASTRWRSRPMGRSWSAAPSPGSAPGPATTSRGNIGRLNADGSVDIAFNPGAESQVLTLACRPTGRSSPAGTSSGWETQADPLKSMRNYIGRLNADGSVDGTFDPGADNVVNAVAVQADGAIVAGGIFDRLGGGGGAGVGDAAQAASRGSRTPTRRFRR